MDKRLRTETNMMSFANTFHQTPQRQTRKREKHTAPGTMDLDEFTRGACEVEASGGPGGTHPLQMLGFTVQQSTNSPIFY